MKEKIVKQYIESLPIKKQALAFSKINDYCDLLKKRGLNNDKACAEIAVNVIKNGYDAKKVRAEVEKLTTPELYEMLLRLEPDVEVEKNNRNRVMRIIERIHDGDNAIPGKEKRYESLRLGVSWPREVVNQRIDERLERRLEQGMIEEVQKLMDEGATTEFLLGLGLEYRLITEYLTGKWESKEAMLERLAINIKQFAKRQMTWFRRNEDIIWLDMSGDFYAQACEAVEAFLKEE